MTFPLMANAKLVRESNSNRLRFSERAVAQSATA